MIIEPSWSAEEHDRALDRLAARENFPVAARLLPARHRADLRAVYGFARLVDDIGDEAPAEQRPKLLGLVDDDLDRVFAGRTPNLPQLRRLARTVHAHRIPEEPFRDLVQANRQDQTVHRYDTFEELKGYCALSAAPVGRIVLRVFRAHTPRLEAASDDVCTALQIIEHCQDAGQDYRSGRIYLPGEDLRRFGCAEDDLARRVTPTRLRGVLALQAGRARDLLDGGAGPLMAGLTGWARFAVAGYVAGGRSALSALERGRFDVLAHPPRPRRAALPARWARALGGRGR
ncbi:squalene synthase HpnC [Actinomadura madurae]|uniref:squalene synthase HpnC n=1 Tax=Actinomadura madurae TaxID=1993 RepID=UPI0020D23126|nr:squalene synthase HpnC [Actinomadura madurae]MCP9949124.1 squalene synthase HpnC [Actinomadura madurae]MCP9965887.1 squalene synthase HpnC [Actinomadura madurae]MCQ0010114.1 squalene synthase HpnC [Actinomadura madurae]MCQ0014571.1 squalene synthase HpnC [Actinomadura madurae]